MAEVEGGGQGHSPLTPRDVANELTNEPVFIRLVEQLSTSETDPKKIATQIGCRIKTRRFTEAINSPLPVAVAAGCLVALVTAFFQWNGERIRLDVDGERRVHGMRHTLFRDFSQDFERSNSALATMCVARIRSGCAEQQIDLVQVELRKDGLEEKKRKELEEYKRKLVSLKARYKARYKESRETYTSSPQVEGDFVRIENLFSDDTVQGRDKLQRTLSALRTHWGASKKFLDSEEMLRIQKKSCTKLGEASQATKEVEKNTCKKFHDDGEGLYLKLLSEMAKVR